jgi:hypothetical protein
MNAGLAWDIIRSIQNPFEANTERFSTLAIRIPIFTVMFFIVLYASIFKIYPDLSCGDYEIDDIFVFINSILSFLCIFYMVYSLWIINRGLSRQGLNKEVR